MSLSPRSVSMSTAQAPRRALWKILDSAIVTAVAVVAVYGAVLLVRRATADPPPPAIAVGIPVDPVPFRKSATLGSDTAPVVVVSFSDFECPFCIRFAKDVFPALRTDYVDSGRVQFAFRHLPLPIHARAERAAGAAECAAGQGRFWPMHDALFGEGGLDSALETHAVKLGLHLDLFRKCLEDPVTTVQEDIAFARQLGISGTPTFLIGRRVSHEQVRVQEVVSGYRSGAEFGQIFDALLAVAPSRVEASPQ
jgi:protein-disulfide isomerase